MFKKYWQLFISFFKIGCFTFGGGYAMIPMIQKEVIDRRGWVGAGEFIDLLSLSQSAPGPVSINTSIMIGHKLYGKPGAVMAFLGTVLPSFIILLIVAIFFSQISDNPTIISIFKGVRPAVVALILQPVVGFAKGMKYWEYGILLAVAAAIYFGLSPVWFIAGAIATGLLYTYYRTRRLSR